MRPKVLILGGGVAGLAAAVELTRLGHPVTLLEEKHFLGGRAYSFRDSATGEELDNGQHVLMTCYGHTWKFLRTIGTLDKLYIQPSLKMHYREKGGRELAVKLNWRAKWGLMRALLKYRDITRFSFINRDCVPVFQYLDEITVDEWLAQSKISEELRRTFYRPLALAALNQDPAKASAAPFVQVLRHAFRGFRFPRIAIPVVGLSDLLVTPALSYLKARGADVQLNRRVEKLSVEGNRVAGVQTQDGKTCTADFYVCALPPRAVGRIVPGMNHLEKLNFSVIISIYLWLDGEITSSYFEGLLGTKVQWLFNRKKLFGLSGKAATSVGLVISGADGFLDMSKDQIVRMVQEELDQVYPAFSKIKILHAVVIKEKSATISHEPGQLRLRPGPQTTLENFFMAGDWVNTGLPATIESAVASAHACAKEIRQL